jgi:hypothetical protein
MVHDKQIFNVVSLDSVDELAAELKPYTWTLSTGFELKGCMFPDGLFTEDSTQQYTVAKDGRYELNQSTQIICRGPVAQYVDAGPLCLAPTTARPAPFAADTIRPRRTTVGGFSIQAGQISDRSYSSGGSGGGFVPPELISTIAYRFCRCTAAVPVMSLILTSSEFISDAAKLSAKV